MRGGRSQPLRHVAIEFGDRGIDAVAGMHQASIRAEPAGEVIDRLIASDRLGQPCAAVIACGMFRKPALVVGLKRDAIGVHFREVARHFGRVDPAIEIRQVPFRQLAGLRHLLGGGLRL